MYCNLTHSKYHDADVVLDTHFVLSATRPTPLNCYDKIPYIVRL
jgi:hypothetical protein